MFAKLRKATISLILSVLLSARTIRLLLDGFSWNLIYEYFSKLCRKKKSRFIKIEQEWRVLYMWDQYTFCILSRSVLLRMRNVSNRIVEKIKTHVLCLVTLKKKSRQLWDNVEKYCRAGGATADNTPYAHCMLDTSGYKNTLRICNTYWLSTATIIARTRLTVTLYVHCLSVCLVTFLLI